MTRTTSNKTKWRGWVLVLGLFALLAVILAFSTRQTSVYHQERSPDGRFELVVYRESGGFRMPGQGGDASGIVRLIETQSGRVLASKKIDMVQMLPQVAWKKCAVDVRPFVEWPLPCATE